MNMYCSFLLRWTIPQGCGLEPVGPEKSEGAFMVLLCFSCMQDIMTMGPCPQKKHDLKKKKMIHGHWTKLKETGKQNREIIFFPISKPQSSTSPQWTSWTMGYHGARPGPHFGVQKLRRVTRAEVAVQTVSPIAWATYACPLAIEHRQSVFLI